VRIAHFVQRYPPALGGSEAYFARLSRHLVERGHRVTVFTTTALDLEAFRGPGRILSAGTTHEGGVEVRRFPLLRLPAQRWLLKLASLLPVPGWWGELTLPWNPLSPAMWRTARGGERFDAVHATALPYGWVLGCARRMARQQRVPFLVTPFLHIGDPNDPYDRTRRTFTHPALLGIVREADRVFVQTEGEQEALARRGVRSNRLVLQGLGVDIAGCTGGDRAHARASWGFDEETVVIGHLANLSVEKGSLDLRCAAERAWKQGSRFGLVLAGPQTDEYRRFCDMGAVWSWWKHPGRVRHLGELNDAQKRDFFAGIDLFCLPSRADSFGLVFLEAWANGVPSIAYRAGGVPWVIRHGEDGLLVRCGDIDGLASALIQLETGAVLRRRLGEQGRSRLAHDFCWENKLRIVEEVLLTTARTW
jgi:glycosyltransferase involved in cell wall biosynthesis